MDEYLVLTSFPSFSPSHCIDGMIIKLGSSFTFVVGQILNSACVHVSLF